MVAIKGDGEREGDAFRKAWSAIWVGIGGVTEWVTACEASDTQQEMVHNLARLDQAADELRVILAAATRHARRVCVRLGE